MNKHIIPLLVASLFMAACTKDFEEIDKPTTTSTNIDPKYLFTRALVTGSGISVANWQYLHQLSGSVWAQHFANIKPGFTWDNYEPTSGDDIWDWYYARSGFASIYLNYHVVNLSQAQQNPIKEACARIWRVYMYQLLTDFYGDLPYFDAFETAKPKFDPQQEIYADMLNELKAAVVQIIENKDKGYEGYGEADVLYNGDLDKWVRFANSLILRLALRVSNVAASQMTIPALSGLDVTQTMQSNSDMALMMPDPNGPTYHVKNPLVFVYSWNEVRLSKNLFDHLSQFNDPRLEIFAEPNANGEYVGLENGQLQEELSANYTDYYRPEFCNIGSFFIQPNTPHYLFTYAETCFLLAEAAHKGWVAGSAEAYYNQGIRASFNQFGIEDESVITDYLNGAAKYDASKALEQIYTQRWIALFPNGHEAWSVVRQTGFPQMMQPVYTYPGNNQMPRRKSYPVNERRYNADNYNSAVSRMGGDSQYTRVWWDGGN